MAKKSIKSLDEIPENVAPPEESITETAKGEDKKTALVKEVLETPSNEAEEISAKELALPLVENMPEPTGSQAAAPIMPEAPEEPSQRSERDDSPRSEPINTDAFRDRSGKTFDPQKHKANSDGTPRKNARGDFISATIGRPSAKKEEQSQSASTARPEVKNFINTGAPDDFDQAAELYLQFGYGVAASFLSEGIRPDDQTEHNSLKIPLAAVLREKGKVGLSPTEMLLLACGAYFGKKMGNPTVRERVALWYMKGKSLFDRWTGRKTKRLEPIKVSEPEKKP